MMNTDEMTGYPSIDKPWLKYYSKEFINKPLKNVQYIKMYILAILNICQILH